MVSAAVTDYGTAWPRPDDDALRSLAALLFGHWRHRGRRHRVRSLYRHGTARTDRRECRVGLTACTAIGGQAWIRHLPVFPRHREAGSDGERRAVPDTVRLLKQPDRRSDCPQADRNGESRARLARCCPGMGRFGGWYGRRRMTPLFWLPPDLVCCAGHHGLRNGCSVGPRTHAASQDG